MNPLILIIATLIALTSALPTAQNHPSLAKRACYMDEQGRQFCTTPQPNDYDIVVVGKRACRAGPNGVTCDPVEIPSSTATVVVDKRQCIGGTTCFQPSNPTRTDGMIVGKV
jgi:hypothetical protein